MEKRFKILYCICFVLAIVFGNLKIAGPISINYVVTIVLFIGCILDKNSFPKDNYLRFYMIFIALFALTSIGHDVFPDFLKAFVTYYLSSFAWIWATYILVNKYEGLRCLILSFCTICFVNSIVTIGQHFMDPMSFAVARALNLLDTTITDSILEKSDETVTTFCLYGILGAVPNGYYSAVASVMSLYLFNRKKRYVFLVYWLFTLFGLYCVQERAAMVAGLAFSTLFMIKIISNTMSVGQKILIITVSFALLLYGVINFDLNSVLEGSRYESFEIGSRDRIFALSNEYCLNHLFDANLFDFFYQTNLYPHNLLYNSIMYGTLVGAFIIFGIMFWVLLKAFRLIKSRMNSSNSDYIMFAFALFAYTIVTLTHNASIISGDVLYWILAVPIIIYTKPYQKEMRRW